ncbi:signal peptidase I [Lederbergia galactosidilyticus]|uniref:S26 family signal peptidase n=1 Tax=Lederbergia galactosidilytica TaxID=217031 RepID=UPI001AEB31D4|nr:S26 family signal peptidase [Lederbergia galactosidilytica]MBP1916770.1 signal peptidase I [Lederbergia galactosidilytica]
MKHIGLSFGVLLILVGCSFKTSLEPITDQYTTPNNIATIETISPEMFIYQHHYDNMDRGNHDYIEKPLVIEPLVDGYKISRGDVIFFHTTNEEKDISRIVALPSEEIKIIEGQVYINDKKLDTFYGFAHRLGLEKDRYFEMMDDRNQYNNNGMREYFDTNMDQIKLASDEYYFIDDDWMRGKMGVIKEQDIAGFVLGYIE